MHTVIYRSHPSEGLLLHIAEPDRRLCLAQHHALFPCVCIASGKRHRRRHECLVRPWSSHWWELASHSGLDRCSFCPTRRGDDWYSHHHPITRPHGPVSRICE